MSNEKNTIPSFYRGFLKLFSGLVLVKALNFIFSIILPRFYLPVDYASLGVFTATILILTEINTLKLDVAIFFPKEDQDALEIVHSVFLISFYFSTIILLISILFIAFGFYNSLYVLTALVLITYGVGQALSAWFNRKKEYKKLNVSRIVQAASTPILSLIFIFFFKWHFGLILGFVLGQVISTLYLVFYFKHLNIKLIKRSIVLKYIRRYNQFPKYGVLSSLVNSISNNSIVIFIKYFFGDFNAGYYTLASRVLSIPGGMYSTAISQIYLQQASLLDNRALRIYSKKIVWFGFLLGIIPAILFLFFGQSIFGFVFGVKWLAAGKMAQYIALWFFFQILIGPVGFMLDIKQKLKFELNWNFLLLIFRALAVIVGVLLNDLYIMLLILTVVGILMNMLLLRYVLKLTDNDTN